MPKGWTMRESTPRDIQDLRAAYRQLSDGILVDAFCLDTHKSSGESIEAIYRKYGLKRMCSSYTLFHDNRPQAYFVADQSDRGINLSDLINSIKVIVPLNSSVPWYILHAAICECGKEYGTKTITLQVFPFVYMDRAGIHYKKRHVMWVLDTRYLHSNIDIMKNMARFNPANYLKGVVSSFVRRT
jgi:hypothetical protein